MWNSSYTGDSCDSQEGVKWLREKLYRFMQGRYGNDQLNRFLLVIMIICVVLSMLVSNLFYFAGVAILIIMYVRMLSKNRYKRASENEAYLRIVNKLRFYIERQKNRMLQRKTHHIYTCPTCKQKIRIPRGKGKIAVRCPKCGTEFIKHS